MRTLARLFALALPCLALSFLGRTPASAGPLPPVCALLESQAAYISGGGLSLLQRECSAEPLTENPGVGVEQLQDDIPVPDEPPAVAQPLQLSPAPLAGGAIGGLDRRLNDAADELPATTQSETTLETCGATMLAAWNDSGSARFGSFTGYARSTDGGNTWQDRGHFAGMTGSDPWLASDRACRFYFSAITFIGGCSAIGVLRSDDGGQTWNGPANASPGTPCGSFQDKETIEVDRTTGLHSGNVYACWDDRGESQIRVLFSRSTDGGGTFSDPIAVDAFPGGYATGCQVAVAPSGEVVVAWTSGLTLGVYSRTSLDGGQTFGPPTSISFAPVIGSFGTCGSTLRPLLTGNIRTFNWTSLAVNPLTGTLHLAWNDNRSGDPDIMYTRSTDLGAHWSAPTRLNDDAGTTDQFQPALAFTQSGVLRAAWYDRRVDPANNYLIDVYSAASVDDGETFGLNERITDTFFGVPPINPNFDPNVVPCYMGDYIAVAGAQDTHYMAWGDNRNILAARPDPDVYFDARSAAGQSYTVTRTDDPEPNGCSPGDCSLREAVIAANATLGEDTITIPAGGYRLSRIGTGEDASASGDIDLAGNVSLLGAGAGVTTLDADGIERALEVLPGVAATVSGLTVTGGETSAGPGGPVADGGGVYNALNLILTNSTISGNSVRLGKGGGLASASEATLNNVTIAGNSAGPQSDLRAGNLSNAMTGSLTLANSIIAGGEAFNCTGPITSLGHNIDDGETCGLDAEGDLVGTDPLLGPLTFNGGPTLTMSLEAGSPARDAGGPATCETSDQRGYARPVDGDGDTLAACDVGALEMGARPLGDVDCDFETDSADALWVLRYVAAIQPFAGCLDAAGDANCDGVIDGVDALAILRRVAALPVEQQPGCPPIG